MKLKPSLSVLSIVLFFSHPFQVVGSYYDSDSDSDDTDKIDRINRCCEDKLNQDDDQDICKDRLKGRCRLVNGVFFDRCASTVVDTFVDNGERFGIGQGNDLLTCLVNHNINEYQFDKDINAYAGVQQAVGVTSASDLDLDFIIKASIRHDTVEELEHCEDECHDREDFLECCRYWVVDIREDIKYWEEFRILGACRDSDICKSRRLRNLRG